ncbi:MAG: cob(I)yrinic acid a,c-diamide adenosyltransferase [Candidatus Auribacterota bacterium]|nr:cob(I)yrinic acid a,c-diamide adenosyltransferase [Candidatus Auribacterota bacterium]
MIQIYTGNGKGKTTAALGLALRALGWGKRVALLQFLKINSSGELKSLARFKNCEIRQFGQEEFITAETATQDDRQRAEAGCRRAEEILRDGSADLLILDEINIALHMNLIEISRVQNIIKNCPLEIELVLTGRYCPPEIISRADYVSEIKEIKHPYREGLTAREGIEY